MAVVRITAKWLPRDPSGAFRAYLNTAEEIWYEHMLEGQTLVAELAAEAAPHHTGQLGEEMFYGGGGESIVTSRGFTVEPGDPYGPQQGSEGFHSPPAALHQGKYYSLMEWCEDHGLEDYAFAIAKTLDYNGTPYMAEAFAGVPNVVTAEGEKLSHFIMAVLDGA